MGSTLKYRSLKGIPDICPPDAGAMRRVWDAAREIFNKFGYSEIIIPVLEETRLFARSIGRDTDIVRKEMYSFKDRSGKDISLRPEGTASVIRAYIEHRLYDARDLVKLYYGGPMFRGERPQKGRLRQFNQIGAEAIGLSDPYIDAELIASLNELIKKLGVRDALLLINSLGCLKDRKKYKEILAGFLAKRKEKFCDDCRRRAETNILRVLDCKKESCRDALKDAPGTVEHICHECAESYTRLKKILSQMNIAFKEKEKLVRGLDYYTGAVFELIHPALGAQDAIAAGGRYDELTKEMGGPGAGAIGYAIGLERLLLVIDKSRIRASAPGVLIINIGEETLPEAFNMANSLREKSLPCEIDFSARSFKGKMRSAHKDGRRYVILLGPDEIKAGKLLLKNMETGQQKLLSLNETVDLLLHSKS